MTIEEELAAARRNHKENLDKVIKIHISICELMWRRLNLLRDYPALLKNFSEEEVRDYEEKLERIPKLIQDFRDLNNSFVPVELTPETLDEIIQQREALGGEEEALKLYIYQMFQVISGKETELVQ